MYPQAYNDATILPEEAPEIESKCIFSSSNAFKAPICAAPFIPPPSQT